MTLDDTAQHTTNDTNAVATGDSETTVTTPIFDTLLAEPFLEWPDQAGSPGSMRDSPPTTVIVSVVRVALRHSRSASLASGQVGDYADRVDAGTGSCLGQCVGQRGRRRFEGSAGAGEGPRLPRQRIH
jgi:hypothetical protein